VLLGGANYDGRLGAWLKLLNAATSMGFAPERVYIIRAARST